MVILSNKQYKALMDRFTELERLFRLQGEAHSTIMHQQSATQEIIRKAAQGLHERISFNRRPLP